ncbi:MAG: TIGR03790 family protein [Terrimicrobiaceae bacterium]|nr:TIGR03790 family protein [Terrimicrobiaceae bacterium]
MNRLAAIAAWLFALLACAPAAEPSREAAATIVLYKRDDAASRALADYYAEKRGIPSSQLLGLPCSGAEEIGRDEFLVTIEAPLRAAFTKLGWWQIARDAEGRRFVASASMRFVAVMRGVPLKIRPDSIPAPVDTSREIEPGSPMEMLRQHNEASVDSELSALFAQADELAGPIGNPYFHRFAPILDVPPSQAPLLVCRLDGPSDAIVRRMIDDSLAAEKRGLWGWAYLDARNIRSGPYAVGDDWITAAGATMRRHGIPVIVDDAPETLPEGFPMTDAAVYYGWYTAEVDGPFARENFHFLPGAIAVHLHSFSAHTLRDPKIAWAAPLLARGAAATMGNVYEPYLELTVHFDVLEDRLLNGFTLAEAAYAGYRGLSWMGIVVGDPLYRPYASWSSMEPAGEPSNIWQRYRAAVLAAGGDPVAAADALRTLAAQTKKSMPLEGLGQAQAAAGDFAAALATLDDAAAMEKTSAIRFRIALEQIEILRRTGRVEDALAKVSAALGVFKSGEAQIVLGRIVLALKPPPPPAPPIPKQP